MVTQLSEYTKNHFERVNFMVCELYLNKHVVFLNYVIEIDFKNQEERI